jgi:hypothetical protein
MTCVGTEYELPSGMNLYSHLSANNRKNEDAHIPIVLDNFILLDCTINLRQCIWSLRKLLLLSSLRFRPPRREWSPVHLRLVQEPPKVWESWILIVDAKSVSRERMLILDAKPVSVYGEKAVSSKKPSQCPATAKSSRLDPLLPLALFCLCLSQKGRYVDCGSHGEVCPLQGAFPNPSGEGAETSFS